MTWTPAVNNLVVMEQGDRNFPCSAGWTDCAVIAASGNYTWDVATFRANSAIKEKPFFVVFSADGPFWADFRNGSVTIPATTLRDGTAPEYLPNQKYITSDIANICFANPSSTAGVKISMQIFQPG